jgi:hypothetical protein
VPLLQEAAMNEPSRTIYPGWDWVIRSYDDAGRFCVETTHRGEHSRDMELSAIKSCGRTALMWKIRRDGTVIG